MYYFLSDTHLGFLPRNEDKVREQWLLDTLDVIALDAKEIFLMGDVFDYWFEYDTVVPAFFYKTLSKLNDLKSNNITVTYLMGNHDFGHKYFFKNELGIEVISHDIDRIIEGKKFWLSHGDGKAYNDYGYLILKKILRSNWANYLFRKLHPDWGIKLASGSSKKSRLHTDSKSYSQKDGMLDFACAKLDAGYDYVVMGHRHRLIEHKHGNGTYFNLGEWFNNPHIGKFDGNTFKLISITELGVKL